MRYIWAIVASIGILIVFTVIKVFYSTIIDNYKKEHINELSKEVYVALGVSELVPLIIAIILIKIVWKKITYKKQVEINSNSKNNSLESKNTINNPSSSLVKAVYNHTKDIANEIKPTINEYKEKHQTSKTDNSNISFIDEDQIYEKVMLEIEEDNKVKSTWARALAQSEGNKDKAESLYIKLRFNELKDDNKTDKPIIKIEIPTPNLDNEEFEINNIEKVDTNKNKSILFASLFVGIIIVLLLMITYQKDYSSNYSSTNIEHNKTLLENKTITNNELESNIKSNNVRKKPLELETDRNSLENELKKYIENYIDKTNKGYSVKELYAKEIKSFSDISYPKDKIFKDKENYLKRWNIAQTRLNNIESINIEKGTGYYIVKYNINFLVYNINKMQGIKGEALKTFILNSDMKIVEEQEKINSKMNFTDPNQLIGTFFKQIDNNGQAKIITSNYTLSEGEDPISLLITKHNNKDLVFYESGFYIDSFKYLNNNKILIQLSNVTTERNYIFDLTNNSCIFIGNGSDIEIINNGEYNGFLKVSGIKTYLFGDDGTSEGIYWFDAIKNIDGKIIKLISKNSKKCIPVKKLLKEKDISYLQQSLNDCIFVDY